MGYNLSEYREKSESNSCNGMMQFKAQKILKSHLSADRRECKGSASLDSNAEAMVALSDRCVELEEERRIAWRFTS